MSEEPCCWCNDQGGYDGKGEPHPCIGCGVESSSGRGPTLLTYEETADLIDRFVAEHNLEAWYFKGGEDYINVGFAFKEEDEDGYEDSSGSNR